jgi:hypothetical protein
MRRSFLFKIAGLAILGALSSFGTHKLVGHLKAAPDDAKATALPKTQISASIDEPPVLAENDDPIVIETRAKTPLPKNIIASSYVYNMKAQTNGNQVVVSASSTIREKRPDVSFVWGLKVMDADRKLLSTVLYDTQIFSMPDGQIDVWPTFQETLNLASGAYKVQLVLYQLTPNFDLTLLKSDPVIEESRRGCWYTVDVRVD